MTLNTSHMALVLFSSKNPVQSLSIPGVSVHRANTEIPFTYRMRVHFLLPKVRVMGLRVTEKQVSLLFRLNLKIAVTAASITTSRLTY